jgi:hypothetical protein
MIEKRKFRRKLSKERIEKGDNIDRESEKKRKEGKEITENGEGGEIR